MREATRDEAIRALCEFDGFDPDAPWTDAEGETYDCGEFGLWTWADQYQLVYDGYLPRPVKKGLVH